MSVQAMQIQLGSLPIMLVCFSNRNVLLAPTQQFKTIVDAPEQEGSVQAIFIMNGFSLFEGDITTKLDYVYNVQMSLDSSPLLKKYLIQQQLSI